MAGFVDRTVADIDSRLKELNTEMTKLQSARLVLVGRRPGRPAKIESLSRVARRGGQSHGRRRETRRDQALALVLEHPGITIPEIASSMGTEPNYLYRVMPHLVKAGEVKRDGQGWYPAEPE